MTNLSDRTVAFLRTIVPVAWGALITWLLSVISLPAEVVSFLSGLEELLVLAIIGAWYALVRWLEPVLPDWLRIVLIGAPVEPTYEARHTA